MPDQLDRELEQLLGDGELRRPNRRRRLTILGLVLVLLVAAFLTLARLSRPPRTPGTQGSCAAVLRFRGRTYDGARVRSDAFAQAQAIGVGTVPPCGSTRSAQYDVRSLVGLPPALAVALPGASDVVYVARGRCRGLRETGLERCLRGGG